MEIDLDFQRASDPDTTPRQLALRLLASVVSDEAWSNEKLFLSPHEAVGVIDQLAKLANVMAHYVFFEVDGNPPTAVLDWTTVLNEAEKYVDTSEAIWREHHPD